MQKVAKSKFLCVGLIVAMLLISSVSFCALNWSCLIDCTNALRETTVGLFRDGLNCYGKAQVEHGYDAGVVVFLQQKDSDGDWINIDSWEDIDEHVAAVDENVAVDPGTYRLKVRYKAYERGEYDLPIETHTNYSVVITVD